MGSGQHRPGGGTGTRVPDRPLRIATVATVTWLLGYALLTGLTLDAPAASLFVGDILYLVPLIAGVLAATVAARRSRGRHRTLWRVLTAAFAAQLAGESIWAAYDYLTGDGPPEPSVADLCYLTASTLTIVAVLVGFGGAGRLRHLRGLVDSLLIIVSLGALGWQLLIRPQLTAAAVWGDLVNVAYPLLDLVLLAVLGIVGMAGHRSVPLAVRLVGVAGAITAVCDMIYTYLVLFSEYDSGSWIDVGFETAESCLFLAAVVAVRRPEPPAERRSFDRGMPLLPIVISVAGTSALVVYDKVRTGVVSDLTLVVVAVLFLAVMLRQYLFAADRAGLAEELRRAVAEQQRLAVTDGLTGLANRRHLMTMLDRLRTAPGGRPVSLLVVDLDHFKLVNDTYGHLAGDAVLEAAAARIAAAARATDLVARYGGEEFVLLLADTDGPEAERLAERIRRRLRDSPIAAGDAVIAVTASIGVATSPDGAVPHLLEAADRALYRAKAQGRDQVTVAVPETERAGVPASGG
ncbi:GGDEF domain-containing protein [Actinoplanes sp. ATCC 53533]|uniref:GGDEF domain-containing protein n=1 Tax=Actinoplanes sp. ATCC 53533 TaxID=1288362 RepID=UPI000F7753D5|nr:GGDEF domain-containing protein [Actinoplanes sp. ATCC 53533]